LPGDHRDLGLAGVAVVMKSIFKKEPSVQPERTVPAPSPRPEPGTIEVTEYTYGITFLDGEMVTADRRDVRFGYEPNDFMVFESFQYAWEWCFLVMDKTYQWRPSPDRGSPFNEVFLARLDQIKSIRVIGSRQVEREVT